MWPRRICRRGHISSRPDSDESCSYVCSESRTFERGGRERKYSRVGKYLRFSFLARGLGGLVGWFGVVCPWPSQHVPFFPLAPPPAQGGEVEVEMEMMETQAEFLFPRQFSAAFGPARQLPPLAQQSTLHITTPSLSPQRDGKIIPPPFQVVWLVGDQTRLVAIVCGWICGFRLQCVR